MWSGASQPRILACGQACEMPARRWPARRGRSQDGAAKARCQGRREVCRRRHGEGVGRKEQHLSCASCTCRFAATIDPALCFFFAAVPGIGSPTTTHSPKQMLIRHMRTIPLAVKSKPHIILRTCHHDRALDILAACSRTRRHTHPMQAPAQHVRCSLQPHRPALRHDSGGTLLFHCAAHCLACLLKVPRPLPAP